MELSSIINSNTNKPYTPEMADFLCKYYNYIVKNKLNTSNEPIGGDETSFHDPKITHREASIRKACFARDGLGFKESFVKAFIKEFDNIVMLYENQPTYTVTLHFSNVMLDGNLHQWTEKDTVKTWGVFENYNGYTARKPNKIDINRIK